MGGYCFRDEIVSRTETANVMDSSFGNLRLQSKNLLSSKGPISIDDFISLQVLGQGSYGKDHQYYAMKILSKSDIKKESQKRHIADERVILEIVNSNFIVNLRLHFAFQTSRKLYLIVDYMSGGELFYYLKKQIKFSIELAKFYAAEILLGLEYLHSKNIIYRDLKPENVLLDDEGHIKLADFGLSKLCLNNQEKVFTMCGTPEYLAPEILMTKQGYDQVCDWWSFGCLLYEMLVGNTPFYSKDRSKMLNNRIKKQIPIPEELPDSIKGLLCGLLQVQVMYYSTNMLKPNQRLGYNGVQEIKQHEFFIDIDWQEMAKKSIKLPISCQFIIKKSKPAKDRRYPILESDITESSISMTPSKDKGLTGQSKLQFSNFTYNPINDISVTRCQKQPTSSFDQINI